jgi:hypothetical protein
MLYPPADPTTLAAMRVLQDRQRKPIVVSNPNDPRLKAYQDSLGLYDNYEKMYNTKDPKFPWHDIPLAKLKNSNRWSGGGFNKNNERIIPYSENAPIKAFAFADESGMYGRYKKPEQPVILQRNNGNLRPDGTPKGKGFFGEIKRPDGKVSTELSIGVNIGGKEVLIPIMVPTLTKSEVAYLLSGKYNPSARQGVDDVISRKAIDFARQRQAEKKPFFATPQEEGKFQPAPIPVPQPMAPMQPSTNVAPAVPEQTLRTMPMPQPEPSKSDTLWGPGQRYSIKDEKVRSMLKAIQRLKK